MKVNFGIVKKYVSDRGFGFISPTFNKAKTKDLFFHIKTVKKSSSSLANQLAEEDQKEPLTFWFQVENTPKGQQVGCLLKPEVIKEKYESEFSVMTSELEAIWKNIHSPLPTWAHQASTDLVGAEKTQQWAMLRERLELEESERKQQLKEQEEERRKVREAEAEKRRLMLEEQRKQKEAEEKKEREARERQLEIEKNEFDALVAEMKIQCFTHSKQVSNYIVSNRLGYKYRHISGIVRMEKDQREWNFNGGFPPRIYARLCDELDLGNQNSGARAVAV